MGLHCGGGQKHLAFLNQRYIFTAPSPKPATMDLPSGENPQAEALRVCLSTIRRSWPVAASHNTTVLSCEVLRMVWPSREKAHLDRRPEWPTRVWRSCPVVAPHNLIVVSLVHV